MRAKQPVSADAIRLRQQKQDKIAKRKLENQVCQRYELRGGQLEKIELWSDGCASQFRCIQVFILSSRRASGRGIPIRKHY